MKYHLSIPHLSGDKRELEYIAEALENNNIGPVGRFIPEFESAVKELTGAQNVLGVVNGTSALHLALLALGIGKGDEVLASTFTFIGSVACISYVGADPVFIDSEAGTWNLDPNLLEDELKSRAVGGRKMPKALILTHIYGQPADMNDICLLCDRYGVVLIEDAAESIGAEYDNRQTGTFGTFGIYSFNGNKIITTGGGGMLVSDDKKLIDKAAYYSSQARESVMHYEHVNVGYNYRLSNLHAAVGVAQMELLQERITARRRIFDDYKKYLTDYDNISLMPQHEKARGTRWLTTALFDGVSTEKMMVRLAGAKIETRPLWKPMHMQPVFKDAAKRVNGTSEMLFGKGLCLPSCSTMTSEDVHEVCSEIKSAVDLLG